MEFNEGRTVLDVDKGDQLNKGILANSKKVGGATGTGAKILALTKKLKRTETNITGNNAEEVAHKLSTNAYNNTQQNKPALQQQFLPKPVIKPVVSQKKFTPKPVVEDNSNLEEQYRYSSVKDAKLHSTAKSHFKPIPQPSDYEAPKAEPQKALNIHQSFEKNRPLEPPKLLKAKLVSHYNTLKANK